VFVCMRVWFVCVCESMRRRREKEREKKERKREREREREKERERERTERKERNGVCVIHTSKVFTREWMCNVHDGVMCGVCNV